MSQCRNAAVRRRAAGACAAGCAAAVLWCGSLAAVAADAPAGGRLVAGKPMLVGQVEQIGFADPRLPPVRIVRGVAPPRASAPSGGRVEIVTFGTGRAQAVKVIRGTPAAAPVAVPLPAAAPRPRAEAFETVRFVDPRHGAVTVVRGSSAIVAPEVALFGPANAGELDRIAFAVDGVESRHGADPRMWRAELRGPQGPMQVSAAAAVDVGGGDRFDLRENRQLGRAYLARMFQRYGNWPDALAAYNWGPGNLDLWIAAGRPTNALPLGVPRYVAKVLRDALVGTVLR